MVKPIVVDVNANGKLDSEDIELTKVIRDIEKNQYKTLNQSILAWVAMVGISIVTILLFTPFVTDARIKSIEEIINLYYVTQASIIGIYMGVNAYMTKQKENIRPYDFRGCQETLDEPPIMTTGDKFR